MTVLNQISSTISETIKDGEFLTVTSEIAEVLIDSTLNDGILKDFPLIGSIIGLVNTGINVKDKLFIKKLLTFLTELENIPAEKRKNLIETIENSNRYRIKVGEKILYIIDKCFDEEKAEILGKLFNAFLLEKLSYDEFLRAATCIENVFIPDLLVFVDERWDEIDVDRDAESLLTAGIIKLAQIDPSLDQDTSEIDNSELSYKITKIGIKIREILTTKPLNQAQSLF